HTGRSRTDWMKSRASSRALCASARSPAQSNGSRDDSAWAPCVSGHASLFALAEGTSAAGGAQFVFINTGYRLTSEAVKAPVFVAAARQSAAVTWANLRRSAETPPRGAFIEAGGNSCAPPA